MALVLALAMADVLGSVSVTVFGRLSPGSAQAVHIFSIVVMGMLGGWIKVKVQPQ